MELLELTPPEFGVPAPGIYVLDDDAAAVYAGPFATAASALVWIEKHQPNPSSPIGDRMGLTTEWAVPGR